MSETLESCFIKVRADRYRAQDAHGRCVGEVLKHHVTLDRGRKRPCFVAHVVIKDTAGRFYRGVYSHTVKDFCQLRPLKGEWKERRRCKSKKSPVQSAENSP